MKDPTTKLPLHYRGNNTAFSLSNYFSYLQIRHLQLIFINSVCHTVNMYFEFQDPFSSVEFT